jgi:hypothetical protein
MCLCMPHYLLFNALASLYEPYHDTLRPPQWDTL